MLIQSSDITDMEDRTRQLDNLLSLYFKCCNESTNVPQTSQQIIKQSQKDYFLESAISLLQHPLVSNQKAVLLSILIKDKFKYYYELIHPAKIEDLYNKLCELAYVRGSSQKAIFNNIAESLALMYLNTFSSLEGANLPQYLERFNVFQEEILQYYFKVLQYCAVDVKDRQIVLDENHRKQIKELLTIQQLNVINQLSSFAGLLGQETTFNKKHLLLCFERWIYLNFNKQIYEDLPKYNILILVLQACQVEETVADATFCVSSIIVKIAEEKQCQYHYEYWQHEMERFVDVCHKKWVVGEHLVVEQVLRMIYTFMERFAKVIVERYTTEVRDKFILPVLQFYQTGMQKVIWDEIGFLKELLANIQSEYRSSSFYKDFSWQIPVSILEVATKIIHYKPEHFLELNQISPARLQNKYEEADAIQSYRYQTLDIFHYICQLMGPTVYLHHIVFIIQELLKHPEADSFLIELEGYLYAIHQPIKGVLNINEDVLFLIQLSQNILKAKDNSQKVSIPLRRTVLKVLEGVFQMKDKIGSLTLELFGLVVLELDESLLFQNAAKTIKKACYDNGDILHQPVLFGLSQLAEKYFHESAIVLGYVNLCCWNKMLARSYVRDTLDFLHIKAFSLESSKQTRKYAFSVLYDVLSLVKKCKFEGKKEMLQEYLNNSWESIMITMKNSYVFGKNQDECSPIEKVVKLFKNIMRVMNNDFWPYMQQLFKEISQLLEKMPLCSFVYLMELGIVNFSKMNVTNELKYMYETISKTSLSHLSNAESLSTYQYLADDFISLNIRVLEYNCAIIVNSEAFRTFIQFVSKDCLNTQVPIVVKAACNYFKTLFMLFWSEPIIKQAREHEDFDDIVPVLNDYNLHFQLRSYMVKESASIISCLLSSLEQAKDNVHNLIVDVLFSQIKAFPQENLEIWQQFIQKLPSDILLQSQKQFFMKLLLEFRQNCYHNFSLKYELKEIDKCLYMISKRMKTSEKRKHFKKHD